MTEHRHPREIAQEIRAGREMPSAESLMCVLTDLSDQLAQRDARIAELERLLRHVYGSVGCGCNPCRSCKEVSARIDAALAAAKGE